MRRPVLLCLLSLTLAGAAFWYLDPNGPTGEDKDPRPADSPVVRQHMIEEWEYVLKYEPLSPEERESFETALAHIKGQP